MIQNNGDQHPEIPSSAGCAAGNRSRISAAYAVCLAEIALDEGLSLSDLAARMDLGLPTVSRIVGALSRRRQKGAVPYGLLRVAVSASERRKREIYLTAHGRTVIGTIARILE